MELTEAQYERIATSLPVQRGNVQTSNRDVLNAILYVAENGCKWRALPKRFGNWHTIYTRMNRWVKAGVLDRVFERMQTEQLVRIRLEVVSLDSTIVKVHPDGTGAFKKNGPQAIGRSRGGWTTKVHLAAANERCVLAFALTPGQAGDAPAGRALMQTLARPVSRCHLLMDRAYEGNETRQLALDLGFDPVVPPNPQRLQPWQYDRGVYCKRNQVERLFRRLKGFRRIFSRFDKLDLMFTAFHSG
ncbi:MAG: IS5 family transposase [Rudaea sp.]